MALRPGFLTVTPLAVGVGAASAHAAGAQPDPVAVLAAVWVALTAHAFGNVHNDFHDALGSDADNVDRIFPFSGGSRLIQNGVLDRAATGRLGLILLALGIASGLALLVVRSADSAPPSLALAGLAGLALAWAYSAPPLALMSRGIGELAIAGAWGLVVAATDALLGGAWSNQAAWLALAYGAAMASVLYVNAFPDAPADARAGKRTAVVRLGRTRAARLAPLVAALPLLTLALGVALGALPPAVLWVAPAALPGLAAAATLMRAPTRRQAQRRASVLTLAAAHAHGILLIAALWVAAPRVAA